MGARPRVPPDAGAAMPGTALLLARMLQFGDSMFPIGGFSFSCGLESAVQKGVVTDGATLLSLRARRSSRPRAATASR